MRRMAGGDADRGRSTWPRRRRFSRRARRIAELYMDDRIVDYIVDIVHATREPADAGLPDLVPLIEFGASPRATISLAQASRAHAFLRGRAFVTPDDVKAIAPDVLRHRVLTTYEAEAEEVTTRRDRAPRARQDREPVTLAAASRTALVPPDDAAAGPADRAAHARAGELAASPASTTPSSRGRAWSSPRCASTSRATRCGHRLERHRAHAAAVREALHRGARADGDARRRPARARSASARAAGSRARSRPSWPPCSRCRPSATTTASARCSSPTASSTWCRRARAAGTRCACMRDLLVFRAGRPRHRPRRRARLPAQDAGPHGDRRSWSPTSSAPMSSGRSSCSPSGTTWWR